MTKKKLIILIAAAATVLLCCLAAIYFLRSPSAPVIFDGYTPKSNIICIDAGHGGSDPGAVNGERYEKDDNLKLARLVAKYIEEAGYKGILTRGDDSYLSLGERCEIANDAGAAYFVSLHRNSAQGAKGVEVWIGSGLLKAEKKLGQTVMAALEDVGVQSSRGVKSGTSADPKADYSVNKNTDMPSCIVELGFITDEQDNLLFDKNLDAYARAIAKAVTGLMKK